MSSSLLELEPQPAMDPSSLSFQNFNVSSGGGGSGGGEMGSAIGSQQAAATAPMTGNGFEEERPAASGGSGFWSIKYYQPWFDVDTVQVLNRIKGSLLPRPKGAFFDLIGANADLYGPLWIATTLIFSMAITGNLASFFAFKPTAANPHWTYNFNQLTLAGSVVYSYVTLLPLLIWLLLRYYEAPKKLADVLCIYGYTLSVFLPISVLCVLPSNLLRWLMLLCGGAISAIFLLSNFHAHLTDCFPYGEGDAKRKSYFILGTMSAFHVVLLVLFKVYFFHYA